MPRPLDHGPEMDASDAQKLATILKRTVTDPNKSAKHKKQLEAHLQAAIQLLMGADKATMVNGK